MQGLEWSPSLLPYVFIAFAHVYPAPGPTPSYLRLLCTRHLTHLTALNPNGLWAQCCYLLPTVGNIEAWGRTGD